MVWPARMNGLPLQASPTTDSHTLRKVNAWLYVELIPFVRFLKQAERNWYDAVFDYVLPCFLFFVRKLANLVPNKDTILCFHLSHLSVTLICALYSFSWKTDFYVARLCDFEDKNMIPLGSHFYNLDWNCEAKIKFSEALNFLHDFLFLFYFIISTIYNVFGQTIVMRMTKILLVSFNHD